MRRWLRMVWRRFVRDMQAVRAGFHDEIVLRRHRKGRCTWIEEPSHGSFRWRKCEYTFCDKREYMADTSARWTPVPSTAPVPQLRGAIGLSPVSEISYLAMRAHYPHSWPELCTSFEVRESDLYHPIVPELIRHLDGHQVIGQDSTTMFTDTYIEGDIIPERPAA